MRNPANGLLVVDESAVFINPSLYFGPGEGGFTTIPGFGVTLDFGTGAEARTLQLVTYDGGPFGAKVLGAEIVGDDANLFSVTPFAPYDFVHNEHFNIDVHFSGTNVPGDYSAQLALHWSEGGGTQTTFYPLIARVAPVPEPAAFATASLALAVAGFAVSRCPPSR